MVETKSCGSGVLNAIGVSLLLGPRLTGQGKIHVYTRLKRLPSLPSFLSGIECWILSNAFSTLIEMIIWFFFYSVDMANYID